MRKDNRSTFTTPVHEAVSILARVFCSVDMALTRRRDGTGCCTCVLIVGPWDDGCWGQQHEGESIHSTSSSHLEIPHLGGCTVNWTERSFWRPYDHNCENECKVKDRYSIKVAR